MSPTPGRVRPFVTAALVGLCGITGALLVSVAYGFSTEYADTGADALTLATSTLGDWAMFLVVPAAFGIAALTVARRHARLRVTTVTLLLLGLTAIGVAVSGVAGAEAKYDRYPAAPDCTDGFTGGPAHTVVRAAQDAYDELDHPGPFSGGGSSGMDGCRSQLMLRGDVDPVEAYRGTLTDSGWRIAPGAAHGTLRATRAGQAFELDSDRHGGWWVWIGPRQTVAP